MSSLDVLESRLVAIGDLYLLEGDLDAYAVAMRCLEDDIEVAVMSRRDSGDMRCVGLVDLHGEVSDIVGEL